MIRKSFLKWQRELGNACVRRAVRICESFIDAKIGQQTLILPFIGNGQVFLNVNKLKSFILGDPNKKLVELFEILQQDSQCFYAQSQELFTLQGNDEGMFEYWRQEYNSGRIKNRYSMWIYFSEHCKDKTLLFNEDGKLLSPYGHHREVKFPHALVDDMLQHISTNEVVMVHADFTLMAQSARFGDILYCEVPQEMHGNEEFHKSLEDSVWLAAQRAAKVIVHTSRQPWLSRIYHRCSWMDFLPSRDVFIVFDF